MVVSLKNIDSGKDSDLNLFLKNAGDSLNTFRYFSSRDIFVLNNHLITVMVYEDELPVGYGHLDKDGETIWLGICVCQNKKGKGYGKLVMNRLIEEAVLNKISSLKLTVDSINKEAIMLYKKFAFKNCNEVKPGVLLMELSINDFLNK
jgi:GNAT superfamily N-acetyltransferase